MPDLFPDVERKNSATTALERLAAAARARIPAAPVTPSHATLPNGQVLNRSGEVIFTPTPRDEKKPL